jgi:hypothetical protein
MSKRKKTTTSKNTQPKLTKVQLTKKITALDRTELQKLADQTGIIGAAFRINYHLVKGTYNRTEAVCSKCIQPMTKLLATAERYDLNDEEIEQLGNSTAMLAHKIFNHEFPEYAGNLDLAAQADILFTMLMGYVFSKQETIDYCAANKDGRVGILVVFNVKYDLEEDEFDTNLSIKSRDNFEQWIIDSNELVAEDKATILKG